MVDLFVAELKRSISEPRIERYRRPAGADDLDMLSNYFWNMAIADALLCSLGTVEVLLRNTIHNTLSDFFGRSDWYDGTGLLEEKQIEQRDDARRHIESRGKPVTPERMISNLTFGFWVTLLSGNYNDRFWRPMRQRNLITAFPHAPRPRRNEIQNKYYRANNLRNLAFHHEPLFDYPDLVSNYNRAYEAIAWIDPTMVTKTRLFDRFPDVHANGRAAVEVTLRSHLGL
jgi:hypothetical protein